MMFSALISVLLVHSLYFHDVRAASLGTSDVMVYLSQYGYVSSGNFMNSSKLLDRSILRRAIEDFQSFAGLSITGEMNDETEDAMKLSRCGVKDTVDSGSDSRSNRYALQGSSWKIKNLTYRITKYPTNLHKTEVDKELQKAFAVWSEYIDLTFKQMRSGSVNIEIKFERGEHGDGDPFDGPGGTLAHAYFPEFGGHVHFDAAEQWTIGKYKGINLFQVAAHEIGHSLGLSHSNIRGALMAPFYSGYLPFFELHSDDITGIQRLYGTKTVSTTSAPVDRNDNDQTPSVSLHDQILCRNPKIDAIFQSAEGHTYVFKGNQYWRLNERGIEPGYPKLISSGWPGLPGNLDSAFTYKNGKTYFFKGKQHWRYKGRKMDGDYPKDISVAFSGIPNDIDAAMVWSGSGNIFFFKGAKFWRFDPRQQPPVKNTYPKPISDWEGIPNDLDAAFQYSNGYSYFFKDRAYYRFNDTTFAVDSANASFPRSTASWWFGCPPVLVRGTIGTVVTRVWLQERDDGVDNDFVDAGRNDV